MKLNDEMYSFNLAGAIIGAITMFALTERPEFSMIVGPPCGSIVGGLIYIALLAIRHRKAKR